MQAKGLPGAVAKPRIREVPLSAGLGRDLDVLHRARWGRDRITIFTHALEMKLDGFTNLSLHFVDGGTGGYATWEVWNVGREIWSRIFDNDGIAHDSPHFLKPACLRMLFSVPGASSSPGFPGTVTRPDFVGCLNWRWLPRITTKYQPSSLS